MEGLAGRAEGRQARRAHLWGVAATDVGQPHESYANPFIEIQEVVDHCFDHGLWQISTSAVEYLRSSEEPDLNPLPDQAINDPTLGGGATRSRRTQIKVRIQASDGVSPRLFDMDCNQSLTLVAAKLCVGWLAPEGTIDVINRDASGPAFARSGFVFDAYVAISLVRAEVPPGRSNIATLTTHQFVPRSTAATIEIPPFAESVTIYQAATIGAAAVSWTQHYGAPPGANIEIGALPFLAGLRKTQPEILNPDAQFLLTDTADSDRFFTLSWSIRP